MVDITSFVLGMGFIILIGIVVFMFMMNKKIKKTENLVRTHEDVIQNIYVEKDKFEEKYSRDFGDVYREIDSRLDKLANRFQLSLKETDNK